MDPNQWLLCPYGDSRNLNRMYHRDMFLIDFVRLESLGPGKKGFCHIYGQILIIDMEREQYIFNRDRSNPEKVELGGHLSLSVPEFFVWGEGDCPTFVRLYDAEDDHPIAFGLVDWSLSGPHPLNTTLSDTIAGENGCSALVQYCVPSRSMRADIEIMFPTTNPLRLRDGEKGEKLEIYGSVMVEQNFGLVPDRDPKTITLFERTEDEAVTVGAEEPIPFLVPYVIAQVPTDRPSLKISIDLRGRGISRDGSESAPFIPIRKEIPFNLDVDGWYGYPTVFHHLLCYYDMKQKTKNKRHQTKSSNQKLSNVQMIHRFLKLPSDLQVVVTLH